MYNSVPKMIQSKKLVNNIKRYVFHITSAATKLNTLQRSIHDKRLVYYINLTRLQTSRNGKLKAVLQIILDRGKG